jgi:hypothetical protein
MTLAEIGASSYRTDLEAAKMVTSSERNEGSVPHFMPRDKPGSDWGLFI